MFDEDEFHMADTNMLVLVATALDQGQQAWAQIDGIFGKICVVRQLQPDHMSPEELESCAEAITTLKRIVNRVNHSLWDTRDTINRERFGVQ